MSSSKCQSEIRHWCLKEHHTVSDDKEDTVPRLVITITPVNTCQHRARDRACNRDLVLFVRNPTCPHLGHGYPHILPRTPLFDNETAQR
jgi:hypothetical protein